MRIHGDGLRFGIRDRHPAVLATIDHVSGGRMEFGVGAGWYEHGRSPRRPLAAPGSRRPADVDSPAWPSRWTTTRTPPPFSARR